MVGDAEVLAYVAGHDFPAERCATDNPVSTLAGRGVLVTDFVEGVGRPVRRQAIREAGGIRRLADLLGRLQTLPDPPGRAGGAWHHLADGLPAAEVAAAQRMLEGAEGLVPPGGSDRFEALGAALRDIDACEGLPTAFVHPDFVLANVVASPERGLVLVDWSGAGVGPRLWPLAFLLWAEGSKNLGRIDLVLDGYRTHVELEPEEVERVGGAALPRPVIFAVWRFCFGRATLADAARQVAEARTGADAVRERVQRLCG